MMMLGVLLHIICGYATLRDVWWYKDAATSRAADFFILFIHIFRLPVFFVMAGFLGRAAVHEEGVAEASPPTASTASSYPSSSSWLVLYPDARRHCRIPLERGSRRG